MSALHHLEQKKMSHVMTFVLLMGSFHVHLGVADVVDECPIFSDLLRGHLLLFPSARLIVV